MEKFKNALKSVNKFGLLSLVLVAFATLAFTPSKNYATKRWAFDPSAPIGSQYTDVTSLTEQTPGHMGQYFCNDSEDVCTAEYDALDNPNSGSPTPISVKYGEFVLLD